MKKFFLISGLMTSSVFGMIHNYQELKANAQLNFKKKFFPSVETNDSCAVGNCCRMYMNVSPRVQVMGDISFAHARRYACHHTTEESNIFIRYSNEFMSRIYNSGLDYQEVVTAIEKDENLMNFILTGQSGINTQQDLQKIKESFKRVVKDYATKP